MHAQAETNGTNTNHDEGTTTRLSKEQYAAEAKRLFSNFFATREKLVRAREAIATEEAAYSKVVEEIHTVLGAKTFRVRGEDLTPRKTRGGGFYMRGDKEPKLENIDI